MNTETDLQLTPLLVHLLKGILYRDKHNLLWQQLEQQEGALRDALVVLGLDLVLDEMEGYAFLKQRIADENEADIPRLVQRRPLTYPVSLLCVLLRKRLVEGDRGGDALKVVVTRDEIHNDMRVFLKGESNEAKQSDQMDATIKKVLDLGFLTTMKEAQHYEVRRIIKALVDADWLADLNEKLEVYQRHAESDV